MTIDFTIKHEQTMFRSSCRTLRFDSVHFSLLSMSQAHPSSEFSGTSSACPKSALELHIHGCRWAWCRLTFSTNKELVQHVIYEHVRRAIPVMRRDIPMLRRAEEGFGESISMTGIMGGSHSATEGNGAIGVQVVMRGSYYAPTMFYFILVSVI
jgi:hypothetical protein